MSFLGLELSVFSGAPVELYLFNLGTRYWAYTSGQSAVTYLGRDYQPITLSRSNIEQSQEFGKAQLSIEAARDFEPALEFLPGTPDGVMTLTVFRQHRGDAETITYWKGRVVAASFGGSKSTLKCEPVFTSLRRAGLRAVYQTSCRHQLYGLGCNLSALSFMTLGTLTNVSGVTVQCPAAAGQADGYFTAGYLVKGYSKRMIIAHAGSTLTLAAPIIGLQATDSVQLFAGCDHSRQTCLNQFNNLLNFGGFPWIPKKNPFSGDAIV